MASIDKRVVEMKFDNAAFERGVSTTMSTLDKLKEKLNFSGATKGLADLSATANRADFSGMHHGIDSLTTKFSNLQVVGVTALATIANKAVNAGLQMVKSLTIGPIGEGFSDYNAKLTSVRTVMNSTGRSLADVSKYFGQLDEYADTTVFKLGDMTSAFAKFTNAGISIEQAVPAIKGIGNLTALAGQGAEQAQIAYYNLSQSLAGGFLSRIDFKSLELANIATKGFKTELINAAIAAGDLKKTGENLYSIPGSKKAFTAQSLFTDGLQEQFIKATTLTKVLNKYGDTTTALGKKAQAAAQDVKSLPQLLETLRAAVGTQFTSMFETILGNVEQSTKLFTGLSVVLTKIFVGPLAGLNKFLVKIKSMGVLTNFAEGFKNIFKALEQVFINLRHAFREIFPRSSGKTILAISKAFREFTEHLLMGNGTAGDLMKTFKGLFAILKIALSIVGEVAKAFFGLFGIVGTGGGGALTTVLKFTAVAGEFAQHLQEWISQTGAIKTFFAVLKSPLKILKPTVDVLIKLAGALASLFTGDISGFTSQLSEIGSGIKDTFVGLFSNYHNFADILSDGLDRIGAFFSGLAEKAKNSGNTVVAGLAGAASSITGFLSGLFKKISATISAIISIMTDATSEGKDFLSGFGSGAFRVITVLVSRLSDAIKSLKENFHIPELGSFNANATEAATGGGKALLQIGQAIATIWGKITGVAGGVGSVLASVGKGVGGFFTYLSTKIRDGLKNFDTLDLIAFLNTGLLAVVVVSFARFAHNLGEAFKNVGGTFSQLTDTLKTMQRSVQAGMILKIAAAVALLVAAIYVLYKLDGKQLAVAIGALTVILGEMAGMLKVLTKINPKGIFLASYALIAIATAVVILAGAINILGKMDPDVLKQGGIAIGVMLAALAGMAKFLTFSPGILATATALVILSVALTAMAGAIRLYASIPFDVVKSGIEKMAIALIALGIAMAFFPRGMIQKSIGITILAAALTVLTASLTALGLLPNKIISEGIKSMAVALGILAIAANLMVNALPGAAALLIMAGAIAVLAPALALLGKLPNKTISEGIKSLAVVLGIFIAAMYLLTPVIVVMALFAKSLLLIGAAIVLAGTGFALFAGALGLLTVVGAAGFAILTTGLIGLIALLPLIAQQLGYAVVTFANVIKLAAPKVAEAAGAVLMAFVNEIAKRVPQIADAGLRMLFGFLKAIRDHIGEITLVVIDIVANFINAIRSRLPLIVQVAVITIIAFINSLANAIREHSEELGEAGVNLASALISGLVSGLTNVGDIINAAIRRLGNAIVNRFREFFGIHSPSTLFKKLGGFIIQGLANGIGDAFGLVRKVIEKLAHKLPGWMQDVLGIESPSKVFHELGGYVGEGFANGIDSSAGLVRKSTEGMGTEALGAIKTVISDIGDSISTNMDASPTIRPVLDLSHVEANAGKLNSMLTTSPLTVDSASAKAKDISSSYASNQAVIAFNAAQAQKALQVLASTKATQSDGPRPVEFHIGTVEDGDSLLRRARATNKMLTLAEGGDSTQIVGLI